LIDRGADDVRPRTGEESPELKQEVEDAAVMAAKTVRGEESG